MSAGIDEVAACSSPDQLQRLLEQRDECEGCERPIRSELGRAHCAACIMEGVLDA